MADFSTVYLQSTRLVIKSTLDEGSYRDAMKRSHCELEPSLYHASLDFQFLPGKRLLEIQDRVDDALLGGISLHSFSSDGLTCEIGYWILPESQGKGYAQEASETVIAYLFQTLFIKRVSLVCDVRNLRSLRLAERLGFQKEGCLEGLDSLTSERVLKLVFARYP